MARKKNVVKNVIIGYFVQIVIFVLTFITRKVFIKYLSIEYLGINGLFSNLLTILSLAELGLGNIAVFYLYKRVANNNQEEIIRYVNFFKRVFIKLLFFVLIIGIIMIPFLRYIINTNINSTSLYIYYMIFLAGTLMTYLNAHNIALLNAYQDARSYKLISMIMTVFQNIFQIISLVLFKNYMIFIIIQVFSSLSISILTNIFVSKKYAFINLKEKKEEINDKKTFYSDFISIIIYKFGTIIINNTDNILISVLVSTIAVGIYSNYYMVVSAVQTFIGIVSSSLIISVGNLLTENNKSKNLLTFNNILFLYHFIAIVGSICLYFCLNPFITIWIGNEYLFSDLVVISICLNFYFNTIISPIWMFREAAGLFNNVKYVMLITALLNLLISILLGMVWGVFGILIATIVAKILSIFWYEPRILFQKCFDNSTVVYWKTQIKYFVLSILCFVTCYFINFAFKSLIWFLILKCLAFSLICSIIFIIFNYNSNELTYYKSLLKKILRK